MKSGKGGHAGVGVGVLRRSFALSLSIRPEVMGQRKIRALESICVTDLDFDSPRTVRVITQWPMFVCKMLTDRRTIVGL